MSNGNNAFQNLVSAKKEASQVRGSLGDWKLKKNTNVDPNAIFIINDIELIIPPTQIVIKKENLHWSWKTLRSKISTKIASGNAVNYVGLTIVFTPDLILSLHRLITEFKQSPFCYIENNFIRQSIAGDWPVYQNMAFTMTALNVSSMPGYPGSFIVQLELKYFDYRSYTPNFLFKDEWKTKPIKLNTSSDDLNAKFAVMTIPTVVGANYTKAPTIVTYEEENVDSIDAYSQVLEEVRGVGKKLTLNDLLMTHAGTVFDLQPLPNQMQRSRPVPPYLSNIYVRYINDLQMKSLYLNFAIDVFDTYQSNGFIQEFKHLTIGESYGPEVKKEIPNLNRYGKVYGLHTGNVPGVIRNIIVKSILGKTQQFRVYYDQYIVYEESSVIRDIKYKLRKKAIEKMLSENGREIGEVDAAGLSIAGSGINFDASSAGYPQVAGGNTNVSEINLDFSKSQYQKYKSSGAISTYPMNTTNPAVGKKTPTSENMLFYPPIRNGSITSPFGMRDRRNINKVGKTNNKPPFSLHEGIDIVTTIKEESLVNSYGNDQTRYDPSGKKDGSGRRWRIGGVTPIFAPQSGVYTVMEDTENSTWGQLLHTDQNPMKRSDGSSVQIKTRYFHMAPVKHWDMSYVTQLSKAYGSRCKITDDNHKPKFSKGAQIKVNRGDIIGIMGNTGGSTGPHLHLDVRADGVPVDPWLFLNAPAYDGSSVNPTPPQQVQAEANRDEKEGENQERNSGASSAEEKREEDSITESFNTSEVKTNGQELELASAKGGYLENSDLEEVLDSLVTIDDQGNAVKNGREAWKQYISDQVQLNINGYYQYTGDYRATNIYKRSRFLSFDDPEANVLNGILKESVAKNSIDAIIDTEGNEILENSNNLAESILRKKGMIVTSVGGSLQHIVANIPIVGLEYPTHQHLGSIEPSYFFEMQVLSDESTNFNADGLDSEAQIYLALQSSLQSNAKSFRQVPDSYTLCIDSFITRLLGTFSDFDIFKNDETQEATLTKRCLFSNLTVSTIEGSPGRHAIFTQFSETNSNMEVEKINTFTSESENQISEEDIKEALEKVENMHLEDHGRMALAISTFGRVLNTNDSKTFFEEKGALDKYEQTFKNAEGNGENFLAGFETVSEKVFVKKIGAARYDGEDPANAFYSMEEIEPLAYRVIEEYAIKKSKENNWGWGTVAVGTVATGALLWLSKGKITGVLNATARGGQAIGKYGTTFGTSGSGVVGRGITAFGTKGAEFAGSTYGKTAGVLGTFGASQYIAADMVGKQPVPITEELILEASNYLVSELKKHGYYLEEKQVIISNTPIDSDTLNMIMGDNSAQAYRLPDGRVALDSKSLDTIKNHFDGFRNSDQAIVANSANGKSESIYDQKTSKGFYAQDITDFINAYPQYQSLLFKGESVQGLGSYAAVERDANGITQIVQYNKAISFIRSIAYLMMAEEFTGGLDLKTIEEGTYSIIKKIEKKGNVDANGESRYIAPTGMFTAFFWWIRSYLNTWVSNYVANNYGDGVYTYMSESLGYDGPDIDRLFKNLHVFNNMRGAQEFERYFANQENINAMSMFQFMPDEIQRELNRNVHAATSTDYAMFTKTFANNGWSDIASGITLVDNGDNGTLADSGANIVNAFAGDGRNALISKLERFYNARDNIALSYLDLNLSKGGYGLVESTINSYLPFLGGLLNIFKMDQASAHQIGFTGMYPQFNEVLKYLLAPRSIGGVPANLRYKKKLEASDDAGYAELATVFVGRIGQDLTTIGQQLATETVPEFGGTIYGILTTPGKALAGKLASRVPGAGQVAAVGLAGIGGWNIGSDISEVTGGFSGQEDFGVQNDFQIMNLAQARASDKVDPGKYTSNIAALLSGDWFSTLNTNIRQKGSTYMKFIGPNRKGDFAELIQLTRGRNDARITNGGTFLLDVKSTVSKDNEQAKLARIKNMLYILGTQILKNPEVSFAIGMQNSFADNIKFDEYTGLPCYPDLDLPDHPYYTSGNSYATNPDFYMWNVYEDGTGGLSQDIKELLRENTETSILKSYSAMKRFSGAGVVPKNDRSLSIADSVNVSENMSSTINSHYEGSDITYDYDESGQIVESTPCVSAFYGGEISEDTLAYIKAEGARGITALEKRIVEKQKELDSEQFDEPTKLIKQNKINKIKDQIQYIKSLEKGGVDYKFIGKLSNWDGSTTYHERSELQIGAYENMYSRAINIEQMFGSRSGYTGEHILKDQKETKDAFNDSLDTMVAANDQFAHQFDPESLKALARDSVQDIISEKFTMRRAYPTFKLFFIEEDEWESRFINFDDFYSFNGVKEFTVTRSRENPGDVAVITLQNVSGTLDGTKRTAFRDIDYFDRKKHKEIRAHYGEDVDTAPSMSGEGGGASESEQPFGSIVLRPGVNVQLRCGYSNDPNMLEVMISGRITEISWGKNADMCEITVQSFGTELTQYVKTSDKSFWTTHQLLGAMMLEPELQHFGRFEFDHMSQYGENKDSTLDFYQYGQDSDKAKWGMVNATGKFFSDWGGTLMLGTILAIGLAAVMKRPDVLLKNAGKSGTITQMGGQISKIGAVGADGKPLSILAQIFGTIGNGTKALGSGALKLVFQPKAIRGWGLFGRIKSVKDASKIADDLIEAVSAGGNLIGKVSKASARLGNQVLNKRLEKIFAVTNGKYASSVMKSFFNTKAGKEYAQIQAKVIQAIKSGQQISPELMQSYQNGIRAAEKFARVNSFYKGNLSRIMDVGLFSGPGAALGGRMVFRTLWESFNQVWKAGVMTGLTVLGANTAYNQIVKYDLLGLEAMRRFHAKQKARILQSPADDNLYPPNPMSYLRLGIEEGETSFFSWGNAADYAFKIAEITGFASMIGTSILGPEFDYSQPGQLREAYNQWANPQAYMLSKRITVDQSEYFIKNKRIWDIFFEMSMKHPGWVFGTRPYGNKFQYTMFFGVPSQRYWSKPASPFFITRINLLRKYLLREQTKLSVIEETWKNLYGKEEYEAAKKDEEEYNTRYETLRNAHTLGMPLSAEDERIASTQINTVEARLELKLRNKILQEYLMGLENRFVPFRRYHMITSEEDIVNNNISASMHNVANAVNVIFYDSEGKAPHSSVKMKASSSIPENKLNMVNVDLGRNVRGYNSALRFGQGALLYGMREMYRGELLLLGNHRIQPWDICILFDRFNQMSGPVEVKAVTHMFSHETGFLTEIVPNALVIGNEISTYPVLEALKIWMGATMSVKEGKVSISAVEDENTYVDSNGNRRQATGIDGHPDFYAGFDPEWDESLLQRYQFGEKGNFDISEIIPEVDENNQIFRSNSYFANSEGLEQTLNTLTGTAVFASDTVLGTATGTGVGVGGAFLGQMFGPMFKGTGKLSSFARGTASWKGAGVMVFGSMALGAIGGAITGYVHSSDPTRRWLTTAPIILNKLMENEAVIVVPLLKDNIPIVSGLSFKDPMSSWRTVLGNLINEVSDTVMGIQEYTTESMKYGDLFWQRYEEGTTEAIDSRNSWARSYFKAETYYDAFFNRQQ